MIAPPDLRHSCVRACVHTDKLFLPSIEPYPDYTLSITPQSPETVAGFASSTCRNVDLNGPAEVNNLCYQVPTRCPLRGGRTAVPCAGVDRIHLYGVGLLVHQRRVAQPSGLAALLQRHMPTHQQHLVRHAARQHGADRVRHRWRVGQRCAGSSPLPLASCASRRAAWPGRVSTARPCRKRTSSAAVSKRATTPQTE